MAPPVAHGFRSRLRGLIGRDPQPLLIPRCRSVHTFGMRFALDLVWLRDGRPVRVDFGVRPWRVRRCREADAVLELPARRARPPATPGGSRAP